LIDKCITLNQPVGENKLSFRTTYMRVLYTKCEKSHLVRRRVSTVLLLDSPISDWCVGI